MLTHELVHVATGSVAESAAALARGGVRRLRRLARRAGSRSASPRGRRWTVRRLEGRPAALPGGADLDLSTATAAAAYGEVLRRGPAAGADLRRGRPRGRLPTHRAAPARRPASARRALGRRRPGRRAARGDRPWAGRPRAVLAAPSSRGWPPPPPRVADVPRTLVVTNDFPPRPGGIQTFVQELLVRQPADSVVVYASSWRGAEELDRSLPFPVVRYPHRVMLPVPPVANEAARLLAEHGCTSVLFGAAAPLGLLAGRLREAGAQRLVALTHGHEAGWAGIPGAAEPAATGRRGSRRDDLPRALHPRPDRGRRSARRPRAGSSSSLLGSTPRSSARTSTARAVRDRYGLGGPPRGGVRLAPDAAQGPGHADRGVALGPGAGARCGAPPGRRWPVAGEAGQAGRRSGAAART